MPPRARPGTVHELAAQQQIDERKLQAARVRIGTHKFRKVGNEQHERRAGWPIVWLAGCTAVLRGLRLWRSLRAEGPPVTWRVERKILLNGDTLGSAAAGG